MLCHGQAEVARLSSLVSKLVHAESVMEQYRLQQSEQAAKDKIDQAVTTPFSALTATRRCDQR